MITMSNLQQLDEALDYLNESDKDPYDSSKAKNNFSF